MIRETYKLVKTVKKMYPVVQFLKDRYFPDGPVYYSEKALIEFKKKGRKIAPFVIPLVNGIVMEKDGYRTDIVDAPYIAPKRLLQQRNLSRKRLESLLSQEEVLSSVKMNLSRSLLTITVYLYSEDMKRCVQIFF